jgi:hypothetical protein
MHPCTEEGLGTRITFHSGQGEYTTLNTDMIPNREVRISYVDGLFRGFMLWKVSEVSEGTKVCFHSELVPWTRRVSVG